MRCPVCGHDKLAAESPSAEFVVCGRCCETLWPYELVVRWSPSVRRAYCQRHWRQPWYPGREYAEQRWYEKLRGSWSYMFLKYG